MNKVFITALMLISISAFGQVANQGVKMSQYQTTGNMQLYVDPLGNDAKPCTGTGVNACLTIQGAYSKIPMRLRHPVDISIADGTYTGMVVSGFGNAPVTTLDGGFIRAHGTLSTATVATGTATGTATGGTAGVSLTGGTLVDSAQTWTVNDLKGKWIAITSGTGSGQTFPIESNTATTINIPGIWTAPNATSVYAIRKAGARITTGVLGSASPSAAAATLRGIQVIGNAPPASGGPAFSFEDMEVDYTTMGMGAFVGASQAATFTRVRFVSTAGTGIGFNAYNTQSARLANSIVQSAGTSGGLMVLYGNASVASQGSGIVVSNVFAESASNSTLIFSQGAGVSVSSSIIRATHATSSVTVASLSGLSVSSWPNVVISCVSPNMFGVRFDDSGIASYVTFVSGALSVTGCVIGVDGFGAGKYTIGGPSVLSGSIFGVRAGQGAYIRVGLSTVVTGGTCDIAVDSEQFFVTPSLPLGIQTSIRSENLGSAVVRQ